MLNVTVWQLKYAYSSIYYLPLGQRKVSSWGKEGYKVIKWKGQTEVWGVRRRMTCGVECRANRLLRPKFSQAKGQLCKPCLYSPHDNCQWIFANCGKQKATHPQRNRQTQVHQCRQTMNVPSLVQVCSKTSKNWSRRFFSLKLSNLHSSSWRKQELPKSIDRQTACLLVDIQQRDCLLSFTTSYLHEYIHSFKYAAQNE